MPHHHPSATPPQRPAPTAILKRPTQNSVIARRLYEPTWRSPTLPPRPLAHERMPALLTGRMPNRTSTGAAERSLFYGPRLIYFSTRTMTVTSRHRWRAGPDSNRLPSAVLRTCFPKHLPPIYPCHREEHSRRGDLPDHHCTRRGEHCSSATEPKKPAPRRGYHPSPGHFPSFRAVSKTKKGRNPTPCNTGPWSR